MPPPDRIKLPTSLPDLEWLTTDDGSRTLWDRRLNETYHSGCGAVAESIVVYLRNSDVLERLRARSATRIFELGFGTGSAFLLTAALAERFTTPLDYWAIDIRQLPAEFIRQLDLQSHLDSAIDNNFGADDSSVPSALNHSDFEMLSTISSQVADELSRSSFRQFPGCQQVSFSVGQYSRLQLIIGDATSLDFDQDFPQLNGFCDAVYFDAFSPETNPDLWTEQVLSKMHRLLRVGGTLTSYCVKSAIRQKLATTGFGVSRLPGPVGGKREVLRAVRQV